MRGLTMLVNAASQDCNKIMQLHAVWAGTFGAAGRLTGYFGVDQAWGAAFSTSPQM
jgi:hypothetical protein